MTARAKQSAGILFYRVRDAQLEVLLVHPGGPYYARKDTGAWTIPKGEPEVGEALLDCARREAREELGCELPPSAASYSSLGSCRQRGGKLVHAWACEAELPLDRVGASTFELEWPPRSGKRQSFPEVDLARYFGLNAAREKINPAQVMFLEELVALRAG
jgi:predicted NUDIX family NTP pyrophosphohydrolase